MRRSKGCLWIALGFIGFVIIVLVALFNTGDEIEWCDVGLQAGDCEMYDGGDGEYKDTCFCIDRIEISVDDALDIYRRAQSQCQDLNGTLATPDDPDLLLWLSKKMFFSGVDNAYIGLVKMGSEWLWDKVGGTVPATDLLVRADFPPNREHNVAVISVETRKVFSDDDYNEQYASYNYDFYYETDKGYNWYGFSTTDNQQHGAERVYGICHYVQRPMVEVFHEEEEEEEEKIRDQQACVCNSGYVSLSGLNDSTEFTSPNYPSNYCSDLNCRWIVSADQGYVIKVQWVVFSTENRMDMVFVYDGESDDSPMLSSCTGVHCPDRISSHNWMQIHFRSDHVITGLGFKAILTVTEKDPCQCNPSMVVSLSDLATAVILKSPRYPRPYCSSHDCGWTVVAPAGYGLNLYWNTFFLKPNTDFVTVFDGPPDPQFWVANCTDRACGVNLVSSGQSIHVRFISDQTIPHQGGFSVAVTAVHNYCQKLDYDEVSSNIAYSNVREDGQINVGSNANLTCKENYTIHDESAVGSNYDMAVCLAPDWSKELPICSRVTTSTTALPTTVTIVEQKNLTATPPCAMAPFCMPTVYAYKGGFVGDSCVYYIKVLSPDKATAEAVCENDGAHLIQIDSWRMHMDYIDVHYQWYGSRPIWSGLYQKDKTKEPSGRFVYHNYPDPPLAETIGITPWHATEPNNAGGNEDCTTFSFDGLKDVSCDSRAAVVCQYKSEFQKRCEALNDGVKKAVYLAPEPCGLDPCGKCLVYMVNGVHFSGNFYDAKVSCNDVPQGHLIYVPTKAHLDQLYHITHYYWSGMNLDTNIWTGLRQYNADIEPSSGFCWELAPGALGNETSTPWNAGEPNNAVTDGYPEDCVQYYLSGDGVNDVPCDHPTLSLGFDAICQYDDGCQIDHTCPYNKST